MPKMGAKDSPSISFVEVETTGVVTGGMNLYWIIAANNNTESKKFTVSDGDAEVMKFIIPAKDTREFAFDPSIQFTTSINISEIANSVTLLIGYL